jgi:acyl-CoA reductase-like NAD-dependent aldehyde dehydrogenase
MKGDIPTSTNLEQQARALTDNFINVQWVASASERRISVADAATGSLTAEVAGSGPADARASADAASLPRWRAMLTNERTTVLRIRRGACDRSADRSD